MGACATKPRDLKEEGEAPLPLEENTKASAPKVGAEEEEFDENNHTSLGHLFKEGEKKREASENEDTAVNEAITASGVETRGEDGEETPCNEESSVPSLVNEVAEDSNIGNVEQNAVAVEELKDSTLEKKEDSELPSSTTNTA